MLGRDAQWHGLADDPIEDVFTENLRLESPLQVFGAGPLAMERATRSAESSTRKSTPATMAQTMVTSDGTGSFELVQYDEETPETTRHCHHEGSHQAMAMPGGSGGGHDQDRDKGQGQRPDHSGSTSEVSQDDGDENFKGKKDETEHGMEEAMRRFQRLAPPCPRNLETDQLTQRFLQLEVPEGMQRPGSQNPEQTSEGCPRSEARPAQTVQGNDPPGPAQPYRMLVRGADGRWNTVVCDPDEQLDWNNPDLDAVVEALPWYNVGQGESPPRDVETSAPVRRFREEGDHGAMAMPGGSSGDGGRDRDRDGDRRRPDHSGDARDSPQGEDEDSKRRRTPGWLARRGRCTKKDEEGAEIGTIAHSKRSPNSSWQKIYQQGLKPRSLFVHNQGGQSTGQNKSVLVGTGDSTRERAQSVQGAKAMSVAIAAIREGESANVSPTVPRSQVDQLFQTAAMAVAEVEHVRSRGDDMHGAPRAGSGSSGSRMSADQAKGKD